MLGQFLKQSDPDVYGALVKEDERQENSLEMIASENFVSRSVLEAYSSTLTNKYAEGYPGKRYYNGCEHADTIENIAIERAKQMFGAGFANVQPHSGAQANMAVFLGFMNPGETFLGMDLAHGGHLTHGSKVNFSGRLYNVASYGVDPNTHRIDMDNVRKIARETKPKMIIAGFSAYPRVLDFAKFREIADEVGAVLMADIAHIAGLVVAGEHPTPVGQAHITTTTTHKTLRGPRGGLILTTSEDHAKTINSRVFPGVQGGPLMHVIAAKAVAFGEALKPEFKDYIKRVKENAKVLAETFMSRGFTVVSGGTDNHLILLNVGARGLTGAVAADALHEAGITANKNGIPFDPNPPAVTSGVRFGSPALTTRGFGKDEFVRVGNLICDLLSDAQNPANIQKVNGGVLELARKFPMAGFRLG
ncbi:MAG TPA: serine hydroxymethyltransferase [Leptospiraceae bacterium]|nr:serine hydroxymethyltransferase [Leptospiraceae bacterium]HMZ35395.1 serine hydroxymethyltransferase [Leptospiraceae bacterium]HNE24058.1 serine hydroxymethyltransferase [Leptospiraceae bacterium]HNN73532.1 serine hydroxymethyltransferase [Leptospiraceae bacterium]